MTDEELAICREYREAQRALYRANERSPWTGAYKDQSDEARNIRRFCEKRLQNAVKAFDQLIYETYPNNQFDPARRPGR